MIIGRSVSGRKAYWPVVGKRPFERCWTGEEIVTDEKPGKDKEGELLVRLRQKDGKRTAKRREDNGRVTVRDKKVIWT